MSENNSKGEENPQSVKTRPNAIVFTHNLPDSHVSYLFLNLPILNLDLASANGLPSVGKIAHTCLVHK